MQWFKNKLARLVPQNNGPKPLQKQVEEWQRYAIVSILVAAVTIYVVAKIIVLGLHVKSAYQNEFRKVAQEKEQEEPLRPFCEKMPAGYKTDTVNCDEHKLRLLKDPAASATEVAFHEFTDHLSLLNFVLNCHGGQCDGIIWQLIQLFLTHFGQLLLLSILVVVLLIVLYVGPVRGIWHWRKAFRVNAETAARLRKEGDAGQRLLDQVQDRKWLDMRLSEREVAQKLKSTLQTYQDQRQQQIQNNGVTIQCPLGPDEGNNGEEIIIPTESEQPEGHMRKYKTEPSTQLRRKWQLHPELVSNV